MLDLRSRLARILPGLRAHVVARRALGRVRPPHFRPLRSLWAPPPPLLKDRPERETASINVSSAEYYEREDMHEFWANRPFSSPESAGKYLERFGALLSLLRIQPGDSVLDFGCGTGWSSLMLARLGARVLGLDVAPAAVDLARKTAARELTPAQRDCLDFRVFDGTRIDVEDGATDFVVVFDAFHHLPNPMTILAEFHRVLSPHGRFGLAEPGLGHAAAESARAETAHGILEEDLDLEQLYRSALAAGFQDMDLAVPALEPEALTVPMGRMRSFLRGRSRLVPHDLLRHAVLTGPIGVFRKDSYPVISLNPGGQDARIEPVPSRISVAAGQAFRLGARVTNMGETVWLREGRRGRGFVRLGAHLLDGEGSERISDYGRAEIPRDLGQGDQAGVEMKLTAPAQPGAYLVRLDMVNEGICWFAQHGSPVSDVSLEVMPAPGP